MKKRLAVFNASKHFIDIAFLWSVLYLTDSLPWIQGGTLFVVLQGSAEVMEDDTLTSHRVELKQVFCKLLAFAIRARFILMLKWLNDKPILLLGPEELILDEKSPQILRNSQLASIA